MASVVTKTILGRKYVYYSYYDNGVKKEKYCGVESKTDTEKKVIQTKLVHIIEQRATLLEEYNLLKAKLKKLRSKR